MMDYDMLKVGNLVVVSPKDFITNDVRTYLALILKIELINYYNEKQYLVKLENGNEVYVELEDIRTSASEDRLKEFVRKTLFEKEPK